MWTSIDYSSVRPRTVLLARDVLGHGIRHSHHPTEDRMDTGNDFLKSQIHNAVVQHHAFLKALEDHESQAEDPRFRDLCTRYIPTMRDHQRMLENYQAELGAPSAGVLKRALGATASAARDLADSVRESDFLRLVGDIVMSRQSEDTFKTFRESGRALGLPQLAEIGETGERDHDSYNRDANRLVQQLFVEQVRRGDNRVAASSTAEVSR
jgi:hypothetical protein